jgi:hypothetical protein
VAAALAPLLLLLVALDVLVVLGCPGATLLMAYLASSS